MATDINALACVSIAVRRAQRIGQFLEKDIDNDCNVTRAELREVLGLEASRPMAAASGVSVEPTREQVEAIVSHLLAKTLLADTNGDGKINFAEMRQQADDDLLQGWGRVTQLDLQDAVLIRALDTSSDQMISCRVRRKRQENSGDDGCQQER